VRNQSLLVVFVRLIIVRPENCAAARCVQSRAAVGPQMRGAYVTAATWRTGGPNGQPNGPI